MRWLSALPIVLLFSACADEPTQNIERVKGLRAVLVESTTRFVERRYPSVIAPHDETRLALEVGGQLQKIDLEEGQTVQRDEVLLSLDPSTFQLHVQEAEAGLDQARAVHRNAQADFKRQAELWAKRVIPRSGYEDAEAELATAGARLDQAQKRLEIAADNLRKTELRAPFDGVIASVEVDSYATVAGGQRTLTLYAENAFETAFTVPSTVINSLAIGQPVRIRLADLQGAQFEGRITEIGSRATEVSAFPVVAVLEGASAEIKAGMSADVVVDLALPQGGEGFLIPITSFVAFDELDLEQTSATVFVYNAQTGTVHRRPVEVTEVRENSVVVQSGLTSGEWVASAGVSYLREGQRVKLLENESP